MGSCRVRTGRPDVARALTGTDDPDALGGLLDRWCVAHLGAAVAEVRWAEASIGLAIGVDLADGRGIVVKVRPTSDPRSVAASRSLQAALADERLPVPTPVGAVHPFGRGTAGAEVRVDGVAPIARTELTTLATLLHGLTRSATRLGPPALALPEPWGVARPVEQLWPDPPHDPRFDLGVAGPEADVVDAAARRARSTLREMAPTLPRVVGHADWRAEHVLVDEAGEVRAVIDWDSLVRAPEAVVVGQAAAGCTIVWGAPDPHPTPDDVAAFGAAYEAARGVPFDATEWAVCDAATTYVVAYGARCELSDDVTGRGDPGADGWRRLLAAINGGRS